MIPNTLSDAIYLFSQTEQCSNNSKLINNLKTTLKHYVLSGLPQNVISKYVPEKSFNHCLKQIKIEAFIKADFEEIFANLSQAAIEEGKVSKNTVKNYRSVLVRFSSWMKTQPWYKDIKTPENRSRAPRLRFKGANLGISRKGTRAYVKQPYGLRMDELPPHLVDQLEQFKKFCTAPKVAKRQDGPIRQETLRSNIRHILAFLGWFKNIEGWSLDDLNLELLVDKDLLDEYVCWAISEKGNSYNWARLVACSSLLIAKWLYYKRSKKAMYRDIDEIEALRAYTRELQLAKKTEPSRLAIEEKNLTFEQCQEIVRYLRQCCAPRNAKFVKRTDTAIAKSWQRYLVIAIFTYCPVRQREVRELEIGKTLFRETEGYIVRLSPDDHKTGSKTGKGREFRLPPQLTADLDEWLNVWRPKISKDHNFVFVKVGSARYRGEGAGEPLTQRSLHSLVTTTVYHVTEGLFGEGKRTNPHFFRNIAITYQRTLPNQTLEEREGLAEIMGHSVATADKTYSLMTSKDKTAKSVEWWKPRLE